MKNTNDQGSLTEALSNTPTVGNGTGNYQYSTTPTACPTCGKCPTCGSYRPTWPYVYGWPNWNQLPQQTWIKATSNAQMPPTAYPMNVTWYNVPGGTESAALPLTNNTTNNLNQSWTPPR